MTGTCCPKCGCPYFSRTYGANIQCAGCSAIFSDEQLTRRNAEPLIELCRYCNRSSTRVSGWGEKFVRCLRCDARGPRMATRQQAIITWNNQHAPLAIRHVEEVRE